MFGLANLILLQFGILIRWCIVDIEFWENQMLFVGVTQMRVFAYVTPCWYHRCYRYLTILITPLRNNILTNFAGLFCNLFRIKCTKTVIKFVLIWHFYCTISRGLLFSRHGVYTQVGYNPQASACRSDDLI